MMTRREKRRFRILQGSTITVAVALLLAIAYAAVARTYQVRLQPNTVINGVDYGGQTVAEVEADLAAQVDNYALQVSGRGALQQRIGAAEITYHYVSDGSVRRILERQNPYQWFNAWMTTRIYEVEVPVALDENAYEEVFQNLVFLQEDQYIPPQDAYVAYVDGSYQVVEEQPGSQLQEYELYEKLLEVIYQGRQEIQLEELECYVQPAYTAQSEELHLLAEELNQFVRTEVILGFGEEKEILNGDIIHQWLSYDEEFQVHFQEEKVWEYVDDLAARYDTYYLPRTFISHNGSEVTVRATPYGWQINQNAEYGQLLDDIYNARQTTRDPIYEHTAVTRSNSDLGDTYVEIDMTNQRLWFYKNGVEIVATDVVTGSIAAGHTTPGGTFTLKYKQRDTVLRGADYASPVQYWMPFNGGIGLHDASWRWNFGGDIYRTNGSHGCINMPTAQAQKVFENIEAGTPVICYYRD